MNATEQAALEQAKEQFAPEKSQHWLINIGGYGRFIFEGTEAEAEDMRRHKARWERGVGTKRLATHDEVLELK